MESRYTELFKFLPANNFKINLAYQALTNKPGKNASSRSYELFENSTFLQDLIGYLDRLDKSRFSKQERIYCTRLYAKAMEKLALMYVS